MLQPTEPSKVHIPSSLTANGHRESFAIKRRHMTFAQAERERQQRIVQLALLGNGDIVGLDAFVCDLSTYMNTARCTAPCDLFYILKHNFVRLQKRHGTQGLTERLRDIVRLSIQAYPTRISQLPLFTVLMKKYISNENDDDQQQYQAKHSWLLHVSQGSPTINSRRSTSKTSQSAGKTRLTSSVPQPISVRATPIGSAAALRFVTNDHVRVTKLEDRLKRWHAELGENTQTQTQIRPLTHYVRNIEKSIRTSTKCVSFRTSQHRQSMEKFVSHHRPIRIPWKLSRISLYFHRGELNFDLSSQSFFIINMHT